MKYEEIERLRKETNRVTFAPNGSFYIAINQDALFVSQKTNLNLACKHNVCKVGFPITSLEKYITVLEDAHILFSIYNEDKTELYFSNGKETIKDMDICKDCKNCPIQQERDNFIEHLKKMSEINKKNYEKQNNNQ